MNETKHLDPPELADIKPLDQELFEMVYEWGQYGVVVDHQAPAFQRLLQQIKISTSEVPF